MNKKKKKYTGYKQNTGKVIVSREQKRSSMITYGVVLFIFAIYAGLIYGSAFEQGYNLLTALEWIKENPFAITFNQYTIKSVLGAAAIFAFSVLYITSTFNNTRPGEEHGSAKWGNPYEINKYYCNTAEPFQNKILTQNVSISFDGYAHKRNLNTLVTGGAGAGKTKSIIQPNILQGNTSFVILDPKGENLADNANFLKKQGYKIKILNLKEPEKSDCYNPFRYITDDNTLQIIATILMRATTPKESKSNDPYWDQQAEVLLKAFMFYLFHEGSPEDQNFTFLLELLREAQVVEGQEQNISTVDELFNELEQEKPDHIALKYYKDVRNVPGKTYNTIMSVLKGRLEKFNLESIANITSIDTLDLTSLGKEKTALFLVIPDNDTSFNFLISILYLQLFKQLEDYADSLPEKRLPIHVQFLMDEFANVTLPDDFEHTISVSRSRGFSFTIILQNLSQLKALFEKQWESIVGNCDSFVYLGGNENSTYEYISKMLGEETLDTRNTGKSSGQHSYYSTNDQKTGRTLLKPDEVRMLSNDYGILFIRGSLPVIDKKYNVWKHPNAKYSTLKGGEPYDDSGRQFLKEYTYSSEVKAVNEKEFEGLIIDLDRFDLDVEKHIQTIRRKNYLIN